MPHTNPTTEEWASLSPKEQAQRREAAKTNMHQMQGDLKPEVVDDIPEEYRTSAARDPFASIDLIEHKGLSIRGKR
ncbi:hypothetical protein MMC10_007529 [Thelotrema lepadinum]|nr:hypothetical protein [Thelotrema lepadinum]